jgi:hypothetical protein
VATLAPRLPLLPMRRSLFLLALVAVAHASIAALSSEVSYRGGNALWLALSFGVGAVLAALAVIRGSRLLRPVVEVLVYPPAISGEGRRRRREWVGEFREFADERRRTDGPGRTAQADADVVRRPRTVRSLRQGRARRATSRTSRGSPSSEDGSEPPPDVARLERASRRGTGA